MDISAVVKALAPDHDAFVKTIALEADMSEQKDGSGMVRARVIENSRIIVTIELLPRIPHAE